MDLDDKIYVGIDPGKSGAIVFINEMSTIFLIYEMPVIGKEYDEHAIKSILKKFKNVHVIIENVQPSKEFGLASSSSLLECKGLLRGICVGLGLTYTLVSPKTWQKEMWQGIKPVQKKTNRKRKDGTFVYKTDPKPTSEVAAKRLFPEIDLRGNIEVKYYKDTPENRKRGRVGKEMPIRKTKAHDGVIDALLIAEYGRRNYK